MSSEPPASETLSRLPSDNEEYSIESQASFTGRITYIKRTREEPSDFSNFVQDLD